MVFVLFCFFPFISDLFCDMLNGYRRGEGVEIQIQNFSMWGLTFQAFFVCFCNLCARTYKTTTWLCASVSGGVTIDYVLLDNLTHFYLLLIWSFDRTSSQICLTQTTMHSQSVGHGWWWWLLWSNQCLKPSSEIKNKKKRKKKSGWQQDNQMLVTETYEQMW